MIINATCNGCTEPTKYPVGLWDGETASGYMYECKNESCNIYQLKCSVESEQIQNRIKVQEANARNKVFAGYIAALRKSVRISMMKMSQIAGCSPAEYSAYEHERKMFDIEAYRKCEEYLNQRRNRYGKD